MKYSLLSYCIFSIALLQSYVASAQNSENGALRKDKLYTMSGLGFSFPVGETADYLKPKFSTTIGLNYGVGNGGLFLYPKVSLHAYRFDEQLTDAGYETAIRASRSTTYLLNLALGYRKMLGNLAFYGFAGGGGGIILTPRVTVDAAGSTATLDNKNNKMLMVEGGLGLEYSLGGAALFIEAGYMRGLDKMQERSFQASPISVGLKPNLSKLFKK